MKGFIYLLEIAVASILIVVVLGTFFTIRVKQDWDAPDLVGIGNNMIEYVGQNETLFLNLLDEDFAEFEKIKPANVGYGLKVSGSPKTNIIVGCAQPFLHDYIQDELLTKAYVNGRSIEFHIETFNIANGIPNFMDAVVLINYTDYSTYLTTLDSYLKGGGTVVAINATYENDNAVFNYIFGLNELAAGSSGINAFTAYDPETEDIEKYFFGIGFDVGTEWYIWEDAWDVTYGLDYVNISRGPTEINFLYVGSTFNILGPDGNTYTFKVKKIGSGTLEIQALDKDFVFRDFSDSSDVSALNEKIVGPPGAASMTTNGTAIWISDFTYSDEYRTLVKAAILSRTDDWVAKGVYTTKETTTVSSFFSLCCDMPETSELEITLWYVI